MLFNSLAFVIFFIVVTTLYFVLPHKYRWALLLFASCYFYMAFVPVYILILGTTILVDYFAAIYIEKSTGHKRKMYLLFSIISTCLILFVFKYFNFFNGNFKELARLLDWNYPIASLRLILPIGLSFHTFQSLSYVIEVYRGKQKAEKNFGIYSLYVMFYPQLVAGPIERPQNVLHQFYEKHSFNYKRVVQGLQIMLWGFFKKIVIADNLALMVNYVYNDPKNHPGFPSVLATVFFAFQIFCDFSGYSDIAIGTAKVMGFDLMTNFRRPYSSKSISEFWSRWHISLSTWFRDYVYIPLGGNRVVKYRWYFNFFIVFMISGLWHGANWTFVIWGALHGLYSVLAAATKKTRIRLVNVLHLNNLPKLLGATETAITFALVTFAWIFFRAATLHDAVQVIENWFYRPFINISAVIHSEKVRTDVLYLGQRSNIFFFSIACIILMELIHHLQKDRPVYELLENKPAVLRWGLYASMVLIIINLGVSTDVPFIYFQF